MAKALIIILAIIAMYALRPAPPPAPRPTWTEAERRWVEKRHRLHGISGSVRDEQGHWFEREGKRLRL
jgi:hypothetical protein